MSSLPVDKRQIVAERHAHPVGAPLVGLTGADVIVNALSVNLIRLGRLDEGEAALRDVLRRLDTLEPPPLELHNVQRSLAFLLFQRGAYAEAERMAATAVEGMTRMAPAGSPNLSNGKAWWARTLLALGERERGRSVALDAYAGYTKWFPAGHLDLTLPLITLGIAERLNGHLHESERIIREARAILQNNPSSRDRAADAAGELGLTLRALGRSAEADALLKESYDILHAAFGERAPVDQASARTTAR